MENGLAYIKQKEGDKMKKLISASIALLVSLGFNGSVLAASNSENAAEIESLKARIAVLEKGMKEQKEEKGNVKVSTKAKDDWKFGGDFRIRYVDKHDGDPAFEQRVRLGLTHKITEDISFYGRWFIMKDNEMGLSGANNDSLDPAHYSDYADNDAADNNLLSDAYIRAKSFLGPNTFTMGRFGQSLGATTYWSSAGTLGLIDGFKVDIGKDQNITLGFANWSAAGSYSTYSKKKTNEDNFHKKLEDALFLSTKYPASKATDLYGMWVKETTGDNSDFDVRGLGFKTRLNDNLKLLADYTRNYGQSDNPFGCYISLRYKDVDEDVPHSYELRLDYRDIHKGNMYTALLNGVQTISGSDFKGPLVSAHWAVTKKVIIEGYQSFSTKNVNTGEDSNEYSRFQVSTKF